MKTLVPGKRFTTRWIAPSFIKGLRFPGTSGNYITTLDSVLNSITGDIDIRMCLKMVVWNNPGTFQTPLAKRDYAATNPSYRLSISNAAPGGLDATFWPGDGGGFIGKSYTGIALPFAPNTIGWIRVTLDVDNGAGGNTAQFYTSFDGLTWTPYGGPLTNPGVMSIVDSSAPLIIGGTSGQELNGTVYYAEVRNGIDGPVAARYDPTQVQVLDAQTPAVINGWTWNGTTLFKRDDYVRFDGTDGNYLSYPSTAQNSITGDIDIRVRLDDDDTTTLLKGIVGKFVNSNRGYFLRHSSGTPNRLEFLTTPDGNTVSGPASNADTPAGTKWIRVTRVASTGVVTYYTAPDGGSWALLGTPVASTPGNIFASTAPLEIGRDSSNTGRALKGNVYYVEIRNGINGPVAASWDARSVQTPWTFNGTGWAWDGEGSSTFTGKPAIGLSLVSGALGGVNTPDSPANSIVGDIDMRFKAKLNWTPPTTARYLIAKRNGVNSYAFRLDSIGTLTMVWSADGTNTLFATNGVSLNLPPGTMKWVRGTLAVATGTASFYTSDDGQVWVPLGSPTVSGATSIFDSAVNLEIGSAFGNNPTSIPDGTIYYAEVRAGIDGPIVAMFDPARMAKTGTRTPATTVQPGGTPNLLTPNQATIETDATGWTPSTGAPTLAQDATQFLDGTKSLRITAVAAGPAVMAAKVAGSGSPVVPGKLYTATIFNRAATTGQNCQTLIRWEDASHAFISNSTGNNVADSSAGWTASTVTGQAPATAAFGIPVDVINGAVAGEAHFADRISLVEAAVPWTINGSAWDLVAA